MMRKTKIYPLFVFDDDTTYEEWCKALDLDPNDDENSISWSEMKQS